MAKTPLSMDRTDGPPYFCTRTQCLVCSGTAETLVGAASAD